LRARGERLNRLVANCLRCRDGGIGLVAFLLLFGPLWMIAASMMIGGQHH
jgi:hypothetical protein